MDPIELTNEVLARLHPGDELMLAFVGGRLAPEQTERVIQHLDACEDCRELAIALGWSPQLAKSADIHHLPAKRATHVHYDGGSLSAIALSFAFSQELAALVDSDAASVADEASIQLAPGATDGAASLGYLRNIGIDLAVVIGAGNEAAKVRLGDKEYELLDGPADEPRIVAGLTRKAITIWLAGGRRGGFEILRQ